MITTLLGDITNVACDGIVNAANESLLGGGGVDGAIHRAAGPALLQQCRQVEEQESGVRCRPGEAVVTGAGNLPAEHVIHVVGPRYRDGAHQEAEILDQCYKNIFIYAEFFKMKKLAIPSIATGAFGFPAEEAARIAIRNAREAIAKRPDLEVVFVLFNGPRDRVDMKELYDRLLQESAA